MKLSVNEAKLTGLCARNCVSVQQVLFQNLPSGPKSYRAFGETDPWTGLFKGELRQPARLTAKFKFRFESLKDKFS